MTNKTIRRTALEIASERLAELERHAGLIRDALAAMGGRTDLRRWELPTSQVEDATNLLKEALAQMATTPTREERKRIRKGAREYWREKREEQQR